MVDLEGLQILLGSGEPDENISDKRSEYLGVVLQGSALCTPIVVVLVVNQVKGRENF